MSARRLLQRLLCWPAGHDWRVTREAPCSVWLMRLHPYAGCDSDCQRCGAQWRDYNNHRGHGSW